MLRRIASLTIALMLAAGFVSAADAPTLTEVQRLTLQSSLQQYRIAELELRLAQENLQRAQADARALMQRLEKDGYTLDLQKLEYVPNAVTVPKE